MSTRWWTQCSLERLTIEDSKIYIIWASPICLSYMTRTWSLQVSCKKSVESLCFLCVFTYKFTSQWNDTHWLLDLECGKLSLMDFDYNFYKIHENAFLMKLLHTTEKKPNLKNTQKSCLFTVFCATSQLLFSRIFKFIHYLYKKNAWKNLCLSFPD